MISGVFVTGTGTGVGKTMTVAGLLRQQYQRGVQAMIMKPVQTGAEIRADGHIAIPDIDDALRAAGLSVDPTVRPHLCPYAFAPACSPHLAAQQAGQRIEMRVILEHARWLAERYAFMIIEGAGGLMVPLNDTETMADLAAALALPVLLTTYSGLGTINHTLLSLEALRRRGLTIVGVVMNDPHPVREDERYIVEDNARAIETLGHTPVLAHIPWLGSPPDWARLDHALRTVTLTPGGAS